MTDNQLSDVAVLMQAIEVLRDRLDVYKRHFTHANMMETPAEVMRWSKEMFRVDDAMMYLNQEIAIMAPVPGYEESNNGQK